MGYKSTSKAESLSCLTATHCLVTHCTSKVPDQEALIVPDLPVVPQFALAGQGQAEVVVVVVVDGCREVSMGRLGQFTFLI